MPVTQSILCNWPRPVSCPIGQVTFSGMSIRSRDHAISCSSVENCATKMMLLEMIRTGNTTFDRISPYIRYFWHVKTYRTVPLPAVSIPVYSSIFSIWRIIWTRDPPMYLLRVFLACRKSGPTHHGITWPKLHPTIPPPPVHQKKHTEPGRKGGKREMGSGMREPLHWDQQTANWRVFFILFYFIL